MNEVHNEKPRTKRMRRMQAKLIFNPGAGAARRAPIEMADVIHEMQAWKIVPETFVVKEDCDLAGAVREALAQGIRMFVVCGGDGTISVVAGILAGTRATLGIVPSGTRNNIALSLGIPEDLPAAIALLRTGRRIKVDMGMVTCGKVITPFLEVFSVGLGSALFPAADDLFHGNLGRIGDLLGTLVTSPPAEIHLVLDDKQDVRAPGHAVLVANMPFTGLHYQVGSPTAFGDGLLDVLLFADLSKLDLLGYMFTGVATDGAEDPRIQRYKVRSVDIDTQPAMPIMADGTALGEGQVRIEVRPRALAVMAGKPTPETLPDPSPISEAQVTI